MNIIKIIIPNLFKNIFTPSADGGKKANKIWEPSNGGIGVKLKKASNKFIQTTYCKIKAKLDPKRLVGKGTNRKIIAKIIGNFNITKVK